MMKLLHTLLSALMLALAATPVAAQSASGLTEGATAAADAATAGKPVVHKLLFPDTSVGIGMSDNGKWAVANLSSTIDQATATAHLCNIDADTDEDLPRNGSANDVTDDGNLVVGAYQGHPAYWKRSDNKWHTIPVPAGWHNGLFYAVTPDGHYAVGSYRDESLFLERGVMWDLERDCEVQLTNLPQRNMQHGNSGEMRYSSISADGRYVVVSMDFAYLEPTELCCFIYDVQTQSYQCIGFTPDDRKPWTPAVDGLYFVDTPAMSPSGEWVAGIAYFVFDNGTDFPTQYYSTYRMNVLTGDFEANSEDEGYIAFAVCDDGTVLGATPATSPLRDWAVRSGKHWVPGSLIMQQRYGLDFLAATGYDRTGTATAVSSDGKRILTLIDPQGESAVVDFPEALADVAGSINLLTDYHVSPAPGSEFPRFAGASVTFSQPVQVADATQPVQLIDAAGTVKRSASGVSVGQNPLTIELTFRSTKLNAGESYELVIPAGTIALASDATMLNSEIRVPYTGRADQPVAMTSSYPAEGSTLTKIDNTESPVILHFDTSVRVAPGAHGTLALLGDDDSDTTELCPLSLSADGSTLYLYPATTQYLYDGCSYLISVPAGSVTDVSGAGGNEAIALTYDGSYVREISHDTETLFASDFANMSQSLATFLLYEGDHNEPTPEMAAFGFDADNTPWNFSLREDIGSTDIFAASHSAYTATSATQQSDDWMMIPQLYLPDEYCQIEFDAQRYHASANDRLKVVVWPCDDVVNTLTPSLMERVKSECVTVFDEVLPNGGSDEAVTGEWQHYVVGLPQFAGRNVYLALVNDNERQSAVFVDNLTVKHNMKYLVSVSVPESVVDRAEQTVSGTLVANDEAEPIESLTLILRDADSRELDRIEATGLHLAKGESYPFTFAAPLPLTVGREVHFSIDVEANALYHTTLAGSVKDLAFSPTKRVVLEEMTGLGCGNCPMGILAIEHLESLYGDQLLPVSIHTYTGDPYGEGLGGYTGYLGLIGAPTGQVNRSGDVVFPMYHSEADGHYYYTNADTRDTWLDHVQAEFATPADADIDISVSIDETAGTMTIPVDVTYALDADNLHLNLFAVVLEDMVVAYQDNYFVSAADAIFGPWTNGGIYAQNTVRPYVQRDVARQAIGATYAGTGGLLPQTMSAGHTVTANITAPLPQNLTTRRGEYTPYDYAKVIVMLINADNGRVINAARANMTDHHYLSGVQVPLRDDADLLPGQRPELQGTYDLHGRRTDSAARRGNIYIDRGRLTIRR